MAGHCKLRVLVEQFIAATNASDVDASLALFDEDAVIDDPSTGHRFDGHAGIRTYIERYFIGYRTVTTLLSLRRSSDAQAQVKVDFKGDFGHEIGLLDFTVSCGGRIERIDAELV
jgi:ketosteroid isomerase-like protein